MPRHYREGAVTLSRVLALGGASGRAGAGFRLRAQAVAGRPAVPVICSQIAKRTVISVRWSGAVIRWRRGRKWGEMPLNAARNRWAPPTLRKPFSECLATDDSHVTGPAGCKPRSEVWCSYNLETRWCGGCKAWTLTGYVSYGFDWPDVYA
ncbi:hypothetical protein GCM10027073_20240 [Streptomyces chlorus]